MTRKEYTNVLYKGGCREELNIVLNNLAIVGWELHSMHDWGDNFLLIFVRDKMEVKDGEA